MLTKLLNWDRWLFTKINHDWTNAFLDSIYPLWREAITWVPLYIFALLFVIVNFGKKSVYWMLGLLITVATTDQISSHILKPWVNRLRPCHDILLQDTIRTLMGYCSDSRSFTSSHATNHFGVAVFIFFTMRHIFKNWSYLWLFWAASISYGQVYVGVHYPVDVICGALLGSGIGYLTSFYFNKKFAATLSLQIIA